MCRDAVTVIIQAMIIGYHSVYTESESRRKSSVFNWEDSLLWFSSKRANTAKMWRLKASEIKSPLSSFPVLIVVLSCGKFRQVALVPRSWCWDSYQVWLNCISRKSHYRDGCNAMCQEIFCGLKPSSGFYYFLLSLLRWNSDNTKLCILKHMIHWHFVHSQCCASVISV